jgi:hypothetical protein
LVTSVSTDLTRERLPVTEFEGGFTGKVLAAARVLRRTQSKARRRPGFGFGAQGIMLGTMAT